MITAEIVARVCAILDQQGEHPHRLLADEVQEVLEAAEDIFIAKGMREAVKIAQGIYDDPENQGINSPDFWSGIDDVKEAVLAGAQELDPE